MNTENRPANYTILSSILSALVALGIALIVGMQGKAKELSDAVLIQNDKIATLQQQHAVDDYRIGQLERANK